MLFEDLLLMNWKRFQLVEDLSNSVRLTRLDQMIRAKDRHALHMIDDSSH